MTDLKREQEQIAGYLAKINETFSRIASKQRKKAAELRQMANDTIEMEKILKGAISMAKEKEEIAAKKLVDADRRYEKADKLAKFFERVVDKERKKLDNLKREITSKNEEIKAKERHFNVARKRIREKERLLKDREMTLQRVAKELRSKGGII